MDQGGPGLDLYSDKGTFEQRDLKEVSHVSIYMQVASEQIGGCLAWLRNSKDPVKVEC